MFLGRSAEVWSALAAWSTFGVAVLAAFVGFRQVREARRLREDQAKPYVVAFLRLSTVSPDIVNLVVRNYGLTAARSVHVSMDPRPARSPTVGSQEPSELVFFEELSLLAPNEEWSMIWDSLRARYHYNERNPDEPLPDVYTAKVRYRGIRDETVVDYLQLDWRPLMGRHYMHERGVHDVANYLKEMNRTLSKWSEPGYGLKVFVRDGDERDRKQRQHFDEMDRAQERAASEREGLAPDA